jgi:ArsR family transcriptional regulator, nickel/cobalt-responsive transcriptional repressor
MKDAKEFDACARQLKALADPERLKIVQCLLAGQRNVSELATALGDEVVRVSHHLGVLRKAGLVTTEKQGRFVVYSLHPAVGTKVSAGRIELGCCRLDLAAEE